MGAPFVFKGTRALQLNSGGIIDQNGRTKDYDGFVNYIANGTGENGLTTGYLTYANAAATAPTGALAGSISASNSFAASTAAPLRGTYSLRYTKNDVASTIGNGVSYAFTIDAADKSAQMQVSFDYAVLNVAGTAYAAGDLIVSIIDVTNSTLISPDVINIPAGAGKFVANWQSTTSTSYRLHVHQATATTGQFTIDLDRVNVAPAIAVSSAAVTDWVSYTPVWTSNGTAPAIGNGSLTGFWRRVGDSMEVCVELYSGTTTTYGTSSWFFSTPFTMDSTKLLADGGSLGGSGIVRHGTQPYDATGGMPYYNTSTTVALMMKAPQSATDANEFVGATYPFTPAASTAGFAVILKFTSPVVGWSSNVQLANSNVEFASNTSTADAADTTSFAYGPSGSSVPGALTASRYKRVRFKTAIQPTDVLALEFQKAAGTPWFSVGTGDDNSGIAPLNYENGVSYGAGINATLINTTDIDVVFGHYTYNNGATFGAVGAPWSPSTYQWRVRKSSGVNVNALVGDRLGVADGSDAKAGYVGEYVVNKNTASSAMVSNGTFINIAQITLTAGDWDLTGALDFITTGTVQNASGAISVYSANTTTDHQQGDNAFSTAVQTTADDACIAIPGYRASISATTTYYLKAACNWSAGATSARGRISARRVR